MHHAFLYRGSEPFVFSSFSDFFPEDSAISHWKYTSIGIPEVRLIIREVMLTPVGISNHHVLILETTTLTSEAEQAMLKVFEEPRSGVSLVLVLPPGYQLINTLRSRFHEWLVVSDSEIGDDFMTFKNSSYEERLNLISDKLNKKDNHWVSVMKNGLGTWLSNAEDKDQIEVLTFVLTNLNQRGASNKLLLEELALTLRLEKKC